jgi:hypothetical protein
VWRCDARNAILRIVRVASFARSAALRSAGLVWIAASPIRQASPFVVAADAALLRLTALLTCLRLPRQVANLWASADK